MSGVGAPAREGAGDEWGAVGVRAGIEAAGEEHEEGCGEGGEEESEGEHGAILVELCGEAKSEVGGLVGLGNLGFDGW